MTDESLPVPLCHGDVSHLDMLSCSQVTPAPLAVPAPVHTPLPSPQLVQHLTVCICFHEPITGPVTCFLANQRSVRAVQFAYSSDPNTLRQSADLCGGLRRKLIGYCVFNFCLFLLDFNYRRLFWYWEDNQSALG